MTPGDDHHPGLFSSFGWVDSSLLLLFGREWLLSCPSHDIMTHLWEESFLSFIYTLSWTNRRKKWKKDVKNDLENAIFSCWRREREKERETRREEGNTVLYVSHTCISLIRQFFLDTCFSFSFFKDYVMLFLLSLSLSLLSLLQKHKDFMHDEYPEKREENRKEHMFHRECDSMSFVILLLFLEKRDLKEW